MNTQGIRRLSKAVTKVTSLDAFFSLVIGALRWYAIPKQWTKRELESFYISHGGK
jgi:hypothetical protein